MRHALFLAVASLLPLTTYSQSAAPQERIRIGGLEKYEIPGVLTINGTRITGSSIARTENSFIEIRVSTSNEVLTIPRFRHNLVGQVVTVEAEMVRLRLDAQRTVLVPLNAIGTLDVSRGRRPRVRAILAGIGAGIGATLAGAAITFQSCGLDCGGGALIIVGGVAAGVATAALLSGERWQRMPTAWLQTRFAN